MQPVRALRRDENISFPKDKAGRRTFQKTQVVQLAVSAQERPAWSHDVWVVGDEPVLGFEFDLRTAEEYAKG